MSSIPLPTQPLARRRLRTPARTVPFGIVLAIAAAAAFVLISLFPGLFAPGDPLATSTANVLAPPSPEHPFGTDQLGRDVYTRVIWGARYSLLIGAATTVLSVVVGSLLGLFAGLSGGWLDQTLARLLDVLGAFPEILLALFIISFTAPGIPSLIFALGVAGIPAYARLVRAGTLVAVESDFVDHARTFGTRRVVRVFRHVLPHAMAAIPIFATIGLGTAVLSAAGLSFLGLGPQPPAPEWGAMLNEGRHVIQRAWWVAVFPGLLATLVVLSVTAIGRWWQRTAEGRR